MAMSGHETEQGASVEIKLVSNTMSWQEKLIGN